MSLPSDVARCPGVGDDTDGWREGCEGCQRRTSPASDQAWWMTPPPIASFSGGPSGPSAASDSCESNGATEKGA